MVLYLPYLGGYGPLDPTDSFFLESAREMVETNQFLLPMFNYKLWLDKPVYCFWIIAGFYKCFGVSTFMGRLPSALASILTACGIFGLSDKIVNTRIRFLSSIFYLSFPLIAIYSRTPLTDSILTGLLTITVLALYRTLFCADKFANILFYLCLSLAILCKGPIALILIILLWLSQYVIYGINPFIQLRTKLLSAKGLTLFFVILMPWYIIATIQTQGKFFYEFFIHQNFGRMVGKVNHQNPVWFYIPVILAGFLPYNIFLGYLAKYLKNNQTQDNNEKKLLLFSLSWSVICFTLFSLIPTKLPTYILPGSIGIAIASAIVINYLVEANKFKLLNILSLFLGIISLVFASRLLHLSKLLNVISSTSSFSLYLSGFLFIALVFSKPKYKLDLFILSFIMLEAFLLPNSFMTYFNIRQTPFNNITNIIKANHGSAALIYAEQPSIQYELKTKVPSIKSQEEMQAYLDTNNTNKYLIVPQEVVNLLKWLKGRPYTFITKQDKWILYNIQ